MAVLTLQANQPMLIGHYDGVVAINVKQYGAGNLRLGINREDLIAGVNLAPGAIVDGIPMAAADGVKTWFWSGDLWVITDVTGPIMILAPAFSAYINRLKGAGQPADFVLPSEVDGSLSTY
jgi:hypothetical protein